MRAHDERLRVPTRWWAMSFLLVGSFWLAMVVAVPGVVTWTVTALATALTAGLLLSYGSARIVVDDEWLRSGRARIERHHLGTATPLDADSMRLQAGRDADARAFHLLRPYVRTGVRVELIDVDDPTPYWLISSRRADHLAARLNERSAKGDA